MRLKINFRECVSTTNAPSLGILGGERMGRIIAVQLGKKEGGKFEGRKSRGALPHVTQYMDIDEIYPMKSVD